jgi:hypothetical protein
MASRAYLVGCVYVRAQMLTARRPRRRRNSPTLVALSVKTGRASPTAVERLVLQEEGEAPEKFTRGRWRWVSSVLPTSWQRLHPAEPVVMDAHDFFNNTLFIINLKNNTVFLEISDLARCSLPGTRRGIVMLQKHDQSCRLVSDRSNRLIEFQKYDRY